MKTYRDQMHGLQFTPEQKAAMVDALLAASQAPHQRRPQPRKALLIAAVAAAVILCVACASGALQATVAAFSALFGISSPAQTQVIQDRAQVIQTSDTDNGVTVSMESVMGDAHNAQILFSIRRTDGQPLLPQRPDLSWLINQDHALLFEEDSTLNMFTPAEDDQPDRYLLSSALHFVPFEATDSVLYFLFSVSSPNYPLPSGGMSLTLRNLCSYGPVSGKDEKGSIPLVEGTWDLSFHLEYDTSTLSLPTGQTFHHGPLTGTVEEIRLSPISIYLSFRYTFEEETLTPAPPNCPKRRGWRSRSGNGSAPSLSTLPSPMGPPKTSSRTPLTWAVSPRAASTPSPAPSRPSFLWIPSPVSIWGI